MPDLWGAKEAAAATGGVLVGPDNWTAAGVSIDTRTLAPGDLFVALKDVRDGHDFLPVACARAAAGAMVRADRVASAPPGLPLLAVPDVLEGLKALAVAARARARARRVAVTGSVGKTSTKEALALALAQAGITHASVKSYNNHWGVPLTLARMPRDAAYGVFEVGMNHRHEILPLSEQVRPDIAVVTMIAPAHIENLGTLENIAMEKADIFFGLAPGGVALFNADAPHADVLAAQARRALAERAPGGRIVSFSALGARSADVRLVKVRPDAAGADCVASVFGEETSYRLGAPGKAWESNALIVLAVTSLLGLGVRPAVEGLARLRALEGRGAAFEIHGPRGAFTVLDDAYNANPASMAAAIESLGVRPVAPGGRRIAALGDMLELGEGARGYHRDLAAALSAAGVDRVFCAGPLMATLWDALPQSLKAGYADDAPGLAPAVAAEAAAGDVILVKGSNGSRMAYVVDALKALAGREETA
jgi:UDP-N-acetylmuramoyl-tripeptide--D-alanyl-D-alanine ligase